MFLLLELYYGCYTIIRYATSSANYGRLLLKGASLACAYSHIRYPRS